MQVSLEELSVEEQLGVVTQAKVLVGVHGAALTNMMWQPPVTSTVIEIVFEPRLPDYHNMAMAVGRSYKVVIPTHHHLLDLRGPARHPARLTSH